MNARLVKELEVVHGELRACRACPDMIGPVVHGPAVVSKILLVGQAPGPHEGKLGRPFAWTAGKTLFRWFEESLGIDEETFRANVYMTAVARCFPGKAKGGGDRKPSPPEIQACSTFLSREVTILRPELILAVGQLAIEQVLGKKEKLDVLVGRTFEGTFHGHATDVVPLPHPSGASPWHRIEPGKTLLAKALRTVGRHSAFRDTFRERR